MSNQLLVFFVLITMIEGVIFLLLICYFGLNNKINKIEDMLQEHIENENELSNHLLLAKIKSKIY